MLWWKLRGDGEKPEPWPIPEEVLWCADTALLGLQEPMRSLQGGWELIKSSVTGDGPENIYVKIILTHENPAPSHWLVDQHATGKFEAWCPMRKMEIQILILKDFTNIDTGLAPSRCPGIPSSLSSPFSLN